MVVCLETLTLEKCTAVAFKCPENTLVCKVGEMVIDFCAYGESRVEGIPGAGGNLCLVCSSGVLRDLHRRGAYGRGA